MFVTSLACQRTHMAGGRGTCLRQDPATSQYFLEIFDDTFTSRHRVPLTGVPSRTRVSPDGRWAAATVFEHGHSYAEAGFSTRTTLTDTATGTVHADLEKFEVERDGRPFKSPDFNFWGVTFAPDSDTFYVTLSSGGVNYLAVGQVSTRRARVLRTGVECPSLSPDGTHIAYKHRIGRDAWQLRLLDLQAGTERDLSSETRGLDDQVDWLDDRSRDLPDGRRHRRERLGAGDHRHRVAATLGRAGVLAVRDSLTNTTARWVWLAGALRRRRIPRRLTLAPCPAQWY